MMKGILWVALLSFLSCSSDLWPGRLNPKNCVANPSACSDSEVCNFETQVCQVGTLSLRAVDPPAGPVSGGITLRILGSRFAKGAVVRIAGNIAAPIQFVSDSELIVTLPANPAAFGNVPVSVQNPDGSQVTNSQIFHYYVNTLSFVSRPTAISPIVSDLAAVDVNQDGNPDLITCQATARSVAVYLGDGRGGLGPPKTTVLGYAIERMSLGDFNQDGSADVAVLSTTRSSITTLLSNRDGTFSSIQETLLGTTPYAMAVGKFDADNRDDVFLTSRTADRVLRLLGTGTGTFVTAIPIDTTLSESYEIVSHDMNGDGTADFVIPNLFGPGVTVLAGDRNAATSVGNRTDWARAGYRAYTAAVGDFNGDGIGDFVVASLLDSTVYPVWGSRQGPLSEQPPISVKPLGGPSVCRALDLNGDGLLDVICADSISPNMAVLIGDGRGGFAIPKFIPVGDPSFMDNSRFAIADFDRNGFPDIAIVSGSSTQITLLLNQSF